MVLLVIIVLTSLCACQEQRTLPAQSTPGDGSSHTPWLRAELGCPCHHKQGSHLHFRWTPTCQSNNTTLQEAFTQLILIKTQNQTQTSHATIISNIIRMMGSDSPLTAKQHLFKDWRSSQIDKCVWKTNLGISYFPVWATELIAC